MMKVFANVAVFLASLSASRAYKPFKISYEALSCSETGLTKTSKDALRKAVTESGVVIIKDVPFGGSKHSTMSSLNDCSLVSMAIKEHTFEDGTRRRTLATHSIPGGIQKIDHGSTNVGGCDQFSKASKSFRDVVATSTENFALRLSSLLEEGGSRDKKQIVKPLLATASEDSYEFKSFSDVVMNGEHLEHFHSYEKSLSNNTSVSGETIETHIDQGLFIVFTPGLVVGPGESAVLSNGFYVELRDRGLVEVEFDEEDDLVVMLGDGVNQYVNPWLETELGYKKKDLLRATPHSFTMTASQDARVWYGRMVLPPSDALHPLVDGQTFADVRDRLVERSISGKEVAGLGCSSPYDVARQLEVSSCEEGSMYCWHRCMVNEEFGVSAEICAERNLDLRCINPRSQLYVEGHGDFYPGCIDASQAENATDYPTLPEYPKDDELCTEEGFKSYASDDSYDYSHNLGTAVFMWSIRDGLLDGRLVYNGLFGYLSWGLAYVGGGKNGMHNASIIMALPGGNYSAATGLDLSMEHNVQEYQIHPTGSAFRHWQTPVESVERSLHSYGVNTTDCYTDLTFSSVSSINGIPLNLNGTDELVWAANGEDYFAGYHGPNDRARFTINWSEGKVIMSGTEDKESSLNNDDEVDSQAASTAHVKACGLSFALFISAGMSLLV